MSSHPTTIHASAVRIGTRALLIRGPSGAGKSQLVMRLVLAARAGQIPETMLIGDDRVILFERNGQLFVRPAPELAGFIEIRGLGIRRMPYIDEAPVETVIDLQATDATRMPAAETTTITLEGIAVNRIPVASDADALLIISASYATSPYV